MKKIMNNLFKRVLPLALTLMMLLSSTGCMAVYVVSEVADPGATLFGGAKKPDASSAAVMKDTVLVEPETSAFREGVRLSDISYTRPDTTRIYTAIDELNALLDANETDAEKLVSDYDAVLDLFDEIGTATSVAYFYHCMDVTDTYYEQEYNALVAVQYDVDVPIAKLSIRLYEYPLTSGLMNERYSEKFKQNCYLTLEINSETIQPLIRRETELVTRYDELLSTFTIEDGGRQLTLTDIAELSDSNEMLRLVDEYYAAFNQAAGEIYDELLEVRTGISGEFGYTSYADYAYTTLMRSYTPEDVRPLYAAVKKYIVPVYEDAIRLYYMHGDSDVAGAFEVDRDLFIRQLRSLLSEKSPTALEAFDQLLALGNWVYEPADNRMQSEFTMDFQQYKSACICTFWQGEPRSATTLIHELGHYTRSYLTAGTHSWSSTAQLDLDEMDSQGLEFLMLPYFDSFFGDAADAVRTDTLLTALYTIIVGCMEDEFQQAIYADPGMTNEERNDLYARLADEYGFKDLYGYCGTEWSTIPHTFQSPMYYISYAVSVIPVMELLSLAESDPEKAFAAYNGLLTRGTDADFRETVIGMGLSDPLSPDTVKAIAKSIRRML